MPPFMRGESAPFMIWNRNKRSVVIDLKGAAGNAQLSDGWITLGAAQGNFWARLCDLLSVPELKADARFASNAARKTSRG